MLGGVTYWKRADIFGTGEDDAEAAKAAAAAAAAAVLAVLGDSCSIEKKCESPLVCSDLICANAPVDCDFKWGEWSSCSATACGTDGTQVRSYTINKNGAYGGVACEYNNGYEEERPCSMPNCTTGAVGVVGGAGSVGGGAGSVAGVGANTTPVAPSQPTRVSASPTNRLTEMRINWTSLGHHGLPSENPTTIRIYYKESFGEDSGELFYVPVDVNSSHVVITGLNGQNVTYSYYIVKDYPTYGEIRTVDYQFRTPRTYG
jgi:hypothetical protein